ncbi:Panacea domain-containing protein [Indiicoccus explosivorum]|uniref:Panacea domain-containing protein n=1 Tax=Indiicoccus explosivorum TaxID=1917864 RepID=UPI000B436F41|nr:type II toxin-antitoxin system antitoxin SocA domain-containing protein [Indiicoccus explosivorum]
MYKHFIAITSLYSKGIRFAWHYSAEKVDSTLIQEFLGQLKRKNGDIKLGIHKLTTESPEWESVVKSDSYFKDLLVTNDKDRFIELISAEQTLSAVDVAKFILTISPMSPLKLQKILYLSYEKLLKATGVPMFKDPIYAWKHGPVVESVYDAFKSYGSHLIPYEEDDSIIMNSADMTISPSFMRIFSSEHGPLTIKMIHSVIEEYGSLSAWDLVELTHEPGKPWAKVYKPGANKLITDDIISAYS